MTKNDQSPRWHLLRAVCVVSPPPCVVTRIVIVHRNVRVSVRQRSLSLSLSFIGFFCCYRTEKFRVSINPNRLLSCCLCWQLRWVSSEQPFSYIPNDIGNTPSVRPASSCKLCGHRRWDREKPRSACYYIFTREFLILYFRAFLGTEFSSRDGIPRYRDIPGFPWTG